MTKRLTEHHPTHKKLEKIFALMDELGIRFEVSRYDGMIVRDEELKKEFNIQDIEQSSHASVVSIVDLPPSTEFKIVFED